MLLSWRRVGKEKGAVRGAAFRVIGSQLSVIRVPATRLPLRAPSYQQSGIKNQRIEPENEHEHDHEYEQEQEWTAHMRRYKTTRIVQKSADPPSSRRRSTGRQGALFYY